MSFLLVVVRLKGVEKESKTLEKQIKLIDTILMLGLLMSNIVFSVFIVFLVLTSNRY